jgi:hypothetical protein
MSVATCSQGLPHLGQSIWLSWPPPPLPPLCVPFPPPFPPPTPAMSFFFIPNKAVLWIRNADVDPDPAFNLNKVNFLAPGSGSGYAVPTGIWIQDSQNNADHSDESSASKCFSVPLKIKKIFTFFLSKLFSTIKIDTVPTERTNLLKLG